MTIPPKFSLFHHRFITGDKPVLTVDDEFLKKHTKVLLISDSSEKIWKVKLDGSRLAGGGWEEFAKAHSFRDGDVLVFRHDGDEIFHVAVSPRSDSWDIRHHAPPSLVDTDDAVSDDESDDEEEESDDDAGDISVNKKKNKEAGFSCFLRARVTPYSLIKDRLIKDNCLPTWGCSVFNDYDLAEKKWCWMFDQGYTGPLSSSRSFEARRSMAFFAPLRTLGIVLVDILEESNSATELLRFLGHMTHCFRGARSSFGSSSFCIRDRTRCHDWRRATCRFFVFHELVGGRFVSVSLGFRELDSSKDFCVAFGRLWWFDLDRGAVEMLLRSRNIKDNCLPTWGCSVFNDCDLAEKKWCWMFDQGYTGPLSSSRSFEARHSMAFSAPLRTLGIVLVDILEESNSATELLRFLGHMTHCFSWSKIQFRLLERSSFGSSSFCIRDRTRCHDWKRATCRFFVFHELVRGRFVSVSLGFRELDSSKDFCVAFGRSN
ncbi:hypothetical protein F2Q68_00006600 [Brassica cretica]|uniref:TF-B3 domain-containing protein n=1 Tax=Brassica cretica TaxID=69181 RepID=A0A8S9J7G3_BRACR|nr:hypothetical protein F2Q68_00006600 [Brassica cretica]